MEYLEIKAPAKINLGLYILNKRTDGYHNLSTLFYPVCDLYDKLEFRKSFFPAFSCSGRIIEDASPNLVEKARALLEEITGKTLNVDISLEKNIPIGGGMGGGSSDAATALISLNEFFSLNLTQEQLRKAALQLGSDVPFFLKAKPAIGLSRGEVLEEIDLHIEEYIVIVNPGIHISTKEAFAGISPTHVQIDFKSLIHDGKADYGLFRKYITNDFEDIVFKKYPEIKIIKEKLYECGALFSLMSGSGSTVFGIFDNLDFAENAIRCFPLEYFTFLSNRPE